MNHIRCIVSIKRRNYLIWIFLLLPLIVKAIGIEGNVTDRKTHEPLIGATIRVQDSKAMTITDANGHFELKNLKDGKYSLIISCVAYQTMTLKEVKSDSHLTVELSANEQLLNNVTVATKRRLNTDASLLQAQHKSLVIESGVSVQQIVRTQDSNASEVVRRVPGISIIDDKFVIVRGLSQRYNNVWINGAAVPSTEADSRAFSFDIIPSSQLSNLIIVKSPAPELPADFTGGLIKIATRDIPIKTGFDITLTSGWNTNSTFKDFLYNSENTNIFGFSNGKCTINNNDWSVNNRKALPDMKLNMAYSWKQDDTWAVLAALNYSYNNRIILGMDNSRYGIYNSAQDCPEYLYKYNDDQYTTNVHLGGMLNFTYKPNKTSKYELHQIFNQLGKDQYTFRDGYQYISGKYIQKKYEYNYSSRATYNAQLLGDYMLPTFHFDWNLGYSYANRRQPDRRMIDQQEDDVPEDTHYGEMRTEPTDIQRESNKLDEHITSLGINYEKFFKFFTIPAEFKTGVYGEYRNRKYSNKAYYYLWDTTKYPELGYGNDVIGTVLSNSNLSSGAVYLYDETDNRDSYKAHNELFSGYVGINLPIGMFDIYGGFRLESNNMSLINNTTIHDKSTKTFHYNTINLFPSLNLSLKLDDKQLLRLAYGATVNRPEFREVSPSTYYDFDLFSMVKGNMQLKTAYIQNVDLRYEWYPSLSETVSFALFYKHFKNPIEWTYLDAGGTYTYTFENATSAKNFGAELEIKKNLNFIGLPHFTILLNGSLIHSRIQFDDNNLQRDRAMQGQSPYIINTGLFYTSEKGINFGILYNKIGKRIVGVGRVDTSSGASINNDIPDAYEMPRDVIDLSFSKKFGGFEVKASARDILSCPVVFKQYPKFYDVNNTLQKRSQTTKKYTPGVNYSLSFSMNF